MKVNTQKKNEESSLSMNLNEYEQKAKKYNL